MSPKNTYHKFVSAITVAVMLWNIVGWLGFGLIANHVHKHEVGAHCEIALCTCEVESEGDVCTCHHEDYWNSGEHEEENHGNFCYYTSAHSNGSPSQILIPITHFNAADLNETVKLSPLLFDEYRITHSFNLPSGTHSDLLRPPIA